MTVADKLSKDLPIIPCLNCGACCGPVPCSTREKQAVEAYTGTHGLLPYKTNGIDCPWRQQDRCAVYPIRPFLCRLMGHVPNMPCKHFPKRETIRSQQERKLLRQYDIEIEKFGVVTLGELPKGISIEQKEY